MTDRQIKEAQKALPPLRDYGLMTEEQKKLYAELACRDMINSIMIYGNINSPYNEKEDTLRDYLQKRSEKPGTMFYVSRERIIELVREQQEDFKNAVVTHGCYTDSEGCIYSSCKWGDEQ